MSLESPIRDEDNWFIGEDKTLDFYIRTTPRLRAAAANVGETTIAIDPLPEALANGAKVRFAREGEAGVVATLSAAAAIGATSLTVTALAGFILDSTVGGQIQNIAGWALEWTLRLDPESSGTASITKITPTDVAITDGVNGVCRVTITDDDTLPLPQTEPFRVYFHTLRRTDAGLEQILAFGDAVLKLAASR